MSQEQPSSSLRAYFGWRLRHWRQTNGLTQLELGELLGYDHSHLSKVENGDRWPPPDLPAHADRLLDTGGELAMLWPHVERERQQLVRSAPARWLANNAPGASQYRSKADAVAAIERLLVWAYHEMVTELG